MRDEAGCRNTGCVCLNFIVHKNLLRKFLKNQFLCKLGVFLPIVNYVCINPTLLRLELGIP